MEEDVLFLIEEVIIYVVLFFPWLRDVSIHRFQGKIHFITNSHCLCNLQNSFETQAVLLELMLAVAAVEVLVISLHNRVPNFLQLQSFVAFLL